jgi:hypothetical protein
MKTIIAGGRDYQLDEWDLGQLDQIGITEVVSGGAPGVDTSGESWAEYNLLPVKCFPADWKKHGRAAGPIRNRQMAEYADAVALFKGGIGTQSMFNEAKRAGIKIYDYREPKP